MNLQIIGILIQAHLLAKVLTVQAPALEDNNHDLTWMNKRFDRLLGEEWLSMLALIQWGRDYRSTQDWKFTLYKMPILLLVKSQILIAIDNRAF